MDSDRGIAVLATAIGCCLGTASTYLLMRNNGEKQSRTDVSFNESSDNNFAVYGFPVESFATKHIGKELAVGYDRRLRTSTWSYEKLTAKSVNHGNAHRSSSFVEDLTEESIFRTRNSDYKGSGYDKGHLAPAADFSNSQVAMNESFSLSNVSPQNPNLNRGFWAKTVEPFVRAMTENFDEVHVVTGSLFLPKYDNELKEWRAHHKVIGHTPPELKKTKFFVNGQSTELPLLHVPTHFYKIVLGVDSKKKSTPMVAAFVVPNEPISSKQPLTSFLIPMRVLEAVSGHIFFPKLQGKKMGDLCNSISCDNIKSKYKEMTV